MAEAQRSARVNACQVPASFDRMGGGYSEAPAPGPQASHGDPNRALLLAVIERALADARGPTARSSGASCAMLHDRQEAKAFLTDQTGPRARWRRELCALTGIDPAALDAMVAAEKHLWPPLDELSSSDRRQTYSSRHRSSEGRSVPDKRREASRLAMRRKRAREREQAVKPESYSRRALLAGSSVTFPTFRDR